MDVWWNRYVGIPYAAGGCGPSGCDCWGLVRLVYKNEFGIDLPGVSLDVTPGQAPDAAMVSPVLELTREAFWQRVDVPQAGDVIVLRVLGHESHVGLVTTPGYMLHVREGKDAVLEPYDRRRWKQAVRGIWRYAGQESVRMASHPDAVTLIGKPSAMSPRVTCIVTAGRTLAEIIDDLCDQAAVPVQQRRRGHAFVNFRHVPFEEWSQVRPVNGDVVYFRLLPAGGGKGLGFLAGLALVVAATVLTIYAGGIGGGAAWAALSAAEIGAKVGLSVLALGLNMAGMYLINSSMQKSMPRYDSVNVVQGRFLSGGQNPLPAYNVIPQVLGVGRMTLCYLASPYTERADQYTSYLRAAYTAGYGEVEISDIRNGDTLLGQYRDMQYNVYRGKGSDQKPQIFTRDAWEDSPQITLKKNQHNYRTTQDNVDQIQIVLYWPQGLWYRTSTGKQNSTVSSGVVRWRVPGGSWNELQRYIAPRSFDLPSCNPAIENSILYEADGNLDPDNWWLTTYGLPKKMVGQESRIELWRWYTFVFSTDTGNIVMHQGTATDSQYQEPSERLLELMTQSKQLWNATSYIGRLAPVGDNEELLAYVCVKGDAIVEVIDKRDSVSLSGCDISTDGLRVSFTAGERLAAGASSWNFAYSNQTRAFTRIFTFNVPRGQYEIDVMLTSADDDTKANWKGSAGLQVIWQTLRTFTWGTPFKPRKPLAWLEMRVKASDQLNGTLDLVNAAVKSVVLDYDYKSKKWLRRVSSNPAALFRHVLQGPAMSDEHRVPDSKLDIAMLEHWHDYCRVQGFTYFKVVGGDEGMSVYDLLVEIAAAGRAKPLLRIDSGGMWTVLIDEPRTQIMQHFTEHNSWGWTWQKSRVEPPHAVRATFVDKTKGYEQNTVTVYADGYNAGNATKFENWGLNYFEGITEVENVQRVVRRAIAYAVLRSEKLSFRVAQEYLVSEVGDLVLCENSFVQWGLGSGWISEVFKSQDGKTCTGVRLSNDVTLYPETAYGLRVRRARFRGQSKRYDVAWVSAPRQRREVYFDPPLTTEWPEEGDLYQFGYKGREAHQCIIESIRPEAGGIATITVCDYAPELFNVDDGPIPPYDPDISTPQPLPSSYIKSQPIFDSAYSDERAVVVSPDGTITCRIAVQWRNPKGLERHASMVQLRYAVWSDDGLAEWQVSESALLSVGTAYCRPVDEGTHYRIEARYLSDAGITGPWALMVDDHKVLGTTLPPPDVTGLVASIASPDGVRLVWDALDVIDVSHYRIGGPGVWETTATDITVPVARQTGEIMFSVVGVDMGGRVSETPATASIEVLPPKTPARFAAGPRTDGLYLTWSDAGTTWPVRHYEITDEYLNAESKELKTQYVVPPRAAGAYNIGVRAVDIFDNAGPEADFLLEVLQPATPALKWGVHNGVLRISWAPVASSFPVRTYQIYSVNGPLLQETGSTFYDVTDPSGTLGFCVRAVDSAGNVSSFGEISLTVTPPEAPRVLVRLNDTRDGLDISWNVPASMLPVLTYDVVRQWDEDMGSGVIETREQDYGSTDSTVLSVPAVPVGMQTFFVRAVDAAGARSDWGMFELDVRAPEGTLAPEASVIDNNVMLYWQAPARQFFRVDHYDLYRVEEETPVYDGRIDALFASRFERAAGSYTYQLCPVDCAGNVGQCSRITARVSQPPDFVLYDEKDSVFSGEKTNAVLDGIGNMLLPVDADETWQQNVERVGALLSIAPEELTWQQKIDGGFLTWLSPPVSTGRYVEVVDVGALIPSTSITVTVSSTVLEGDPLLHCKIEVSETGRDDDWRVMAEDAFFTFATQFRHVRYTFDVSGGMLAISNINYRLDVKKLSDFGSIESKATDNGPGFIDKETTPDLCGTWVPFNMAFVDVQAGPFAACNEEGKTAYVNFQDVQDPKGFRVFVFDKNGQRVDGRVSWSANGV